VYIFSGIKPNILFDVWYATETNKYSYNKIIKGQFCHFLPPGYSHTYTEYWHSRRNLQTAGRMGWTAELFTQMIWQVQISQQLVRLSSHI